MLPKHILVAIDFSPFSERALDYACLIAPRLDARIHLVNAVGAALPELVVALTDERIQTLKRGYLTALEALVAARKDLAPFGELVVEPGDARDAIIAVATNLKADLIVMGTHGRRGFSRLLLGSVAEEVVRRAPCPVLVVREQANK